MIAAISQQKGAPGTTYPDISIVVPAYEEEANIPTLYDEIVKVMQGTGYAWELIISDDGSRDGTWRAVVGLREKDDRVAGVRLSRNFGHQYALLAGLTAASGRAVITMDADHQHPPSLIPELLAAWERGVQIVNTIRRDTESLSLFKRLTSGLYYRIYSFLSGVPITPGMADFRLLDRKVVANILRFREEGLFLRGIVQWIGHASESIEYMPQDRRAGTTKYSLTKMIRLAWAGISSFSTVPLRIGIFLGLFTSAASFFWMFWAVWARYYGDYFVPGWASALSITSFLFGILFILLGIIGDYVGRILIEVKHRPRFLVNEAIGFEGKPQMERRLTERRQREPVR